MDNEKNNANQMNGQNTENTDGPITADDLLKRLKSNLMQNPQLRGEDIFGQTADPAQENIQESVDAVQSDMLDEEYQADSEASHESHVYRFSVRRKAIEEAMIAYSDSFEEETNEEELSEEDVSGLALARLVYNDAKNDVVESTDAETANTSEEFAEVAEVKEETEDSIKDLSEIFGTADNSDEKSEESSADAKAVSEDVGGDPKHSSEVGSIAGSVKSLLAMLKKDGKQEDKALDDSAEEDVPESAFSENDTEAFDQDMSEKTAVFDSSYLRADENTDSENDAPALREAEQLTFNMTEEELQQSIKEAEAFIYERENVEDPEEIINDSKESDGLYDDLGEKGGSESKEFDQTDLWIASAFGDEDELKNVYGEETAHEVETRLDIDVREYLRSERKNIETSRIDEEYVSTLQNKEIFAKYRKAHKLSLLKLVSTFVLLIAALFYDSIPAFGGRLPEVIDPHNYTAVYVLISLQIVVLAAAISWKNLYNGIRSLIVFRPLPEAIPAVVVIVSTVYHIVHCFISQTNPKVALYAFPVVLCLFVTVIYDYFNLKREIFSFKIVSSKRPKYTINHVDNNSAELENEAFGDYLARQEEVSMFKIGKTGFVNGFRERMNSYSKNNSIITVLLSAGIAISIVFFIVSSVKYDFRSGFSSGFLSFMLSMPLSLLVSFSFPFYAASKKAYDNDSAIVGGVSLDEYAHANTLSFDDKDVFPSYGVKVKSIKVYGDSRIDMILYNASSIFKIIGGPLADVFETATRELGNSESTEIIEIEKDGIEAIIDGQHTYLGKISYIKNKGYEPIIDIGDDELETSGEASIMYMVCDDEVVAKMYTQYTLDSDFGRTLKQLYKAGICIGIKTFDPNIDDKLLGSKVNITKYPVRILRCNSLKEVVSSDEEVNSGIVSKGTPRSLLQTFVLCARVLYATRTAFTVKILSIVFSVLLMAFLIMFGGGVTIPSLYVAVYQLFWLVPVFMISKVYI